MATSGTLLTYVYSSWVSLRVAWSVQSQSVNDNTSTVKFDVMLVTGNGDISSVAKKDISLTVNGTTYSGTCTVGIEKNTTRTLMSKTVTITHTTDGSKTFKVSASVNFAVALGGNWVGTKTVSGEIELPKIDRPSTLTRSGDTMGSEVNLTISRKSSNFTHTLKYTWGGSTVTIATGIGASYKWTPPVSMAAKIPNAVSGSCKLTLETYLGSTPVGSTTHTFTLKVPSSVVPTIPAFTLTEAVSGIAAQFGAFVNTKSKIKYDVTAAGAQGSTIKTYKVSVAGQNFAKSTATTGVISVGAGTKTATVTVIDSRGRSASKSVEYTVLAYTPPRFSSISVHRCDPDHVLNEQGERLALKMAFSVTKAGGKNPCSYTVGYKLTTDDTYTSLPFNFTDYTFNDTLYFTDLTFSTNNSYHIRVQLTDYFGTTEQTLVLYSSRPVFDILYNGSGFAFNKMAEVPDLLDIGLITRFYGGVQSMPITAGTDFDTLRTPNIYHSEVTAKNGGYKNCPTTDDVTFLLEVLPAGNEGQTIQRFTICSREHARVFERHYFSSVWGEWLVTYDMQGHLLWSGEMWMQPTQTISLNEPIHTQPTGINLIFSYYSDGVSQNYNFQSFFVSKYFVKAHGGAGVNFVLSNNGFSNVSTKYLYISDTQIKGHESNEASGTGASGIVYDNKKYVLRYVVGV